VTEASSTSALIERLEREAPAPARAALAQCESLCAERGLALYLVGGAVRDLLLGRRQVDLDLAVEGDVTEVARALAAKSGGKAVLHDRFGTAHVAGPGYQLDLAQTRRESYLRPGALPTVEPVESVLDDLARRDFTINAIALRLTPPQELIDPFGGAADLGAGLVRVLHEASFRDDATRMLRTVRYAARLGFAVEEITEVWLKRDLEFLDAVSGPRLRRELTLIFDEDAAVDATLLAQRLGVLAAVQPQLQFDAAVAQGWREALGGPRFAPRDELGFCLVTNPEDDDAVAAVTNRLHLTGRVEKALSQLVLLRGLSAKLATAANAPADAVELLEGKANSAVWALSLLDDGAVGRACARYLAEWQQVKPLLGGDDLLALGVPSGQQVGALLRRLRRARLEGEVASREDEVGLVRRALREG
jgi:tRNA nucleotidyltransferase (CCA-adding enzyme)